MDRSEQRKFRREKYRVPCRFIIEGRQYIGIVTEISARGMFVQSSVDPEKGSELRIMLGDPGPGEIVVTGRVRRLRRSHRSAHVVRESGFGIEITNAGEKLFELLIRLGLG